MATASPNEVGNAQAAESVDIATDPFIVHSRRISAADVVNDPFISHHPQFQNHPDPAPSAQDQQESRASSASAVFAAAASCKPCMDFHDVLTEILGDPVPTASAWRGNLYVYLPFMVFLLVLVLICVLRHYNPAMTAVLIGFLACVSLTLVFAGHLGRRMGEASFIALGCLCLLAVVMGVISGQAGWHYGSVRQSWWFAKGFWYENVSAQTDSGALVDAAVVTFDNGSSVDSQRSAGYLDIGRTRYCVAPVLSMNSSAAVARVQFWAVGEDCCDALGNFHCDDSRSATAHMGIVMMDRGFPCPGCHADRFRRAVSKAEAGHNLLSDDDAVFIRWVTRTRSFKMWLHARLVFFFIFSCFLAFLALALLGHIANCRGWGNASDGTVDSSTYLTWNGTARTLQQPHSSRKSHRRHH